MVFVAVVTAAVVRWRLWPSLLSLSCVCLLAETVVVLGGVGGVVFTGFIVVVYLWWSW
jgi:hypothetical protein